MRILKYALRIHFDTFIFAYLLVKSTPDSQHSLLVKVFTALFIISKEFLSILYLNDILKQQQPNIFKNDLKYIESKQSIRKNVKIILYKKQKDKILPFCLIIQ